MLLDGLRIMIVGMGMVFIMLMFLIIAVPISAKIIGYFEKNNPSVKPDTVKELPLYAIISAAIVKFRSKG